MIWVAQHGHISTSEKAPELTSFEHLHQKLKDPVISLQKKFTFKAYGLYPHCTTQCHVEMQTAAAVLEAVCSVSSAF